MGQRLGAPVHITQVGSTLGLNPLPAPGLGGLPAESSGSAAGPAILLLSLLATLRRQDPVVRLAIPMVAQRRDRAARPAIRSVWVFDPGDLTNNRAARHRRAGFLA